MIERRMNQPRTWTVTQVDYFGVPWAVQWASMVLDDFGNVASVQWRDCVGRRHEKPLDWVLRYDTKEPLSLRTRDQLYVCHRFVTYVLERDVTRWWEPTK